MNTTATVRIVLSKQTRKQRQKFLATLSRSTGKPIRELKKRWGNGSTLTIPGCTITATVKPWDELPRGLVDARRVGSVWTPKKPRNHWEGTP